MSPKELMYIEDALGHEKQMQSVCSASLEQLTDSELKSFVRSLQDKHKQSYDCFYSLLK